MANRQQPVQTHGMLTRDHLLELDRNDQLASMRSRFILPTGTVYMDGNSLGPIPAATPERLRRVAVEEWGGGLIGSWNDASWIDLPARIGDKIATLVGAPPGTVLVADSTTLNVIKALGAALELRPGRRVVLSEAGGFPTDAYAARSLLSLLNRGHELRLVPPQDVVGAIGPGVACVLLSHVDYRTGRLHDMAAVTAAAHAHDALVVWDLAHSAGALPVRLADCDADFAVGCGYKFLNGGPGAPAFIHVAERLLPVVRFPLAGWLGHAAPFAFEPSFRAAPGIAAAQIGTPPVLSMAALEVGIDLALNADLTLVREKSVRLGETLIALVEQECVDLGLSLASPSAASERGSQVSFRHPNAWPVMQALIARGVIGDMRAPDILRFGLTPLTLRYADLWTAAMTLADVLRTGAWRDASYQERRKVT